MDTLMTIDLKSLAVAVGLTIALVQVFKGFVADRFVPMISLFVGIGLAILLEGFGVPSLVLGLIVGTSAAGTYDQSRIIK